MVNLVNYKTNFDDNRNVTTIAAKFKSEPVDHLTNDPLVSTVLSAAYQTNFITDENCTSIMCSFEKTRKNVVDLIIKLRPDNHFNIVDVAKFIGALQSSIDSTKLF